MVGRRGGVVVGGDGADPDGRIGREARPSPCRASRAAHDRAAPPPRPEGPARRRGRPRRCAGARQGPSRTRGGSDRRPRRRRDAALDRAAGRRARADPRREPRRAPLPHGGPRGPGHADARARPRRTLRTRPAADARGDARAVRGPAPGRCSRSRSRGASTTRCSPSTGRRPGGSPAATSSPYGAAGRRCRSSARPTAPTTTCCARSSAGAADERDDMLRTLKVRDLAIIDELELVLEPGLNVITDETGAWTSILLQALDVALGGRPDADLVRTGAEEAVVEALFTGVAPPALAVLPAAGIAADSEVVIRRVIAAGGRTRAYVNEALGSLALL